jgi:hypothetical protein
MEPLEAYFDASTTHHGKATEVLTLAVLVAPAGRWRQFGVAWAAAMKRGGAEGKILHMTDIMAGRKAFDGWTNEMRETLFRKLVPVVRSHISLGLCGSIPLRYFSESLPEFPERYPSKALFLLALQGTLEALVERVRPSKDKPIACFMESDHATDADATRQFYHLTTLRRTEGWQDFFPSIERRPKGLGSLQGADLVAYEGCRHASEHDVGTTDRESRRLYEELRRTRKITFSTITRQLMARHAAEMRLALDVVHQYSELKSAIDDSYEEATKRMQREFSGRTETRSSL